MNFEVTEFESGLGPEEKATHDRIRIKFCTGQL